jgi:hypothetical protein
MTGGAEAVEIEEVAAVAVVETEGDKKKATSAAAERAARYRKYITKFRQDPPAGGSKLKAKSFLKCYNRKEQNIGKCRRVA